MGKRIESFPKENDGFVNAKKTDEKCGTAEFSPRLDLSVGKKVEAFPNGNEEFLKAKNLTRRRGPQNFHQD